MMKPIIFRADDLGYCEGVNHGIADCVKHGIIRNVGVMIHMDATLHGLQLLQKYPISLGLHVTISCGSPCSSPHLIPSLVDSAGLFKTTKSYALSQQDIALQEALIEVEAQYQQFVKLTGRQPSYMDAHAVNSNHFFQAIASIAQTHGICYSPLPEANTEWIKLYDTKLYVHGGSSATTNPLQALYAIVSQMKEQELHIIVYHPGYIDAFLYEHSSLTTHRVFETQLLCDANTLHYLKQQQIYSLTYDELYERRSHEWPLSM